MPQNMETVHVHVCAGCSILIVFMADHETQAEIRSSSVDDLIILCMLQGILSLMMKHIIQTL